MKKNYSKPNMKMVQLLSAEQLMANSFNVNGDRNEQVNTEDILSNKESTNLWGGKESIWD